MSHLNCVGGQLQYSQHKEKHYSRNSTTYVHWCLLYYSLSSRFCFNSIMYTNTRGAQNRGPMLNTIDSPSNTEVLCITIVFLRTAIHWPSLPSKLPDLNLLTFYTLNASLLSHILRSCIQDDIFNIENYEMWWLVLRNQSTTSSGHGSLVQLPVTTGLSLSFITLDMDYHEQL